MYNENEKGNSVNSEDNRFVQTTRNIQFSISVPGLTIPVEAGR